MGDFHFLVRHALTGAVYLFFVFLGFILFYTKGTDATSFYNLVKAIGKPEDISSLFTLVVTAPVIGITIQGIHIAYLHLFNKPFNDEARKEVAEQFRSNLQKGIALGIPENRIQTFTNHFNQMSADPLFVWLYHSDAPPHLIEWARRRRSYNYLGWNWAIAAIIGLISGCLLNLIYSNWNKIETQYWIYIQILVVVFSIFWIGGAIWLARKMKNDVDKMEYVWTCACLYPNIKNELYKKIVFRPLNHNIDNR